MTVACSADEPSAPSNRAGPYVRVVLLGFMASGKSVVGRRLARSLGWRHLDLDAEIERRTQRSVDLIFRQEGEAAFRKLEAELTPKLVAPERLVFSPGGGWITNPGLFDGLPAGTLTVWLKASAGTILARLAGSNEQPVRPLLAGADPGERAEELLRNRAPLYSRAALAIDTDGLSVAEVTREIMKIVRPESGTAEGSP